MIGVNIRVNIHVLRLNMTLLTGFLVFLLNTTSCACLVKLGLKIIFH